ncbi:MAG: DUF4259 domain-containing protein [Azoarcus sp.]|nr:DUF4259 domain-containing protein [Azoarcus sp.]
MDPTEHPIYKAVTSGDLGAVKRLVNRDNVNAPMQAWGVTQEGVPPHSGIGYRFVVVDTTLLHLAAIGDSREAPAIIDYLVQIGGDINATDDRGLTPLPRANQGDREIQAALIRNGARLNFEDEGGANFLESYILHKDYDLAILALKHGATPNDARGLLRYGVVFDNVADDAPAPILDLLLTIGMKPDPGVLFRAAGSEKDALEKVKALLAAKVPIDPPKGIANYPLIRAMERANFEVFNYLLEQGADIDRGNPITAAAMVDCLGCLEALLKKGANLNPGGYAPLAAAKSLKVVRYLVENGADISGKSVRQLIGESLANRRYDIVDYLISRNAALPPGFRRDSFREIRLTSALSGSGWGHGSFENESALEWLRELMDGDASLVGKTLDAVADAPRNIDDIEYGDYSKYRKALVAAELVAAALDLGEDRLNNEDAIAWLRKNRAAARSVGVARARRAVERVYKQSRLRELWDELGEDAEWHVDVRELLRRLDGSFGR